MNDEFNTPSFDDHTAGNAVGRPSSFDEDYADEYALNDIGIALRLLEERA